MDLTGDDRTIIYGSMVWMTEKLKSENGGHARSVWTKFGKFGFEMERPSDAHDAMQPPQDQA